MFNGGFVDILAAEQTPDNPHWFQGTADAVRQNIKHFAPFGVEYIIVLSGDQLYQMDYRELLNFHIESRAEISVAAFPVTAEATAGFGIMKIQQQGRVLEFHEKPTPEELPRLRCEVPDCMLSADDTRHYLASMGIYVFRKDFLIELLTESTAIDFGKEVFPQSIQNHRVHAFVFDGYWTDIGTIRSFYDANLGLTTGLPQFNFYHPHMPVYTHPRNLPGSKLNNCNLHQSIIAEGCILNGADVKHSVIGVRSRVGGGTTIKNSIIMGADYYETTQDLEHNAVRGFPNIGIGNHCTIINAIIDKNARIGDGVRITPKPPGTHEDHPFHFVRDGIVVIPKNYAVPPGAQI
jgi:glucose-1-phosphate adenylyltransferase